MLEATAKLNFEDSKSKHRIIIQPRNIVSGLVLASSDAISLISCFILGVWGLVYYGNYSGRPQDWQVWLETTGTPHFLEYLFFIVMTLLSFWYAGLYHKRYPFWDELSRILRNLLFMSLMHGSVVLAARWPFSKFVWLASWGGAMVLIPMVRSMSKGFLRLLNIWQVPTVILGASTNAKAAYSALKSEPSMGFEILGFISFSETKDLPAPVTKISKDNLFQTLAKMNHPHLVFALEQSEQLSNQDIIQALTLRYPAFSWIPDVLGLPLLGMEVNHFFSHEVLLLNVKNNLANPVARMIKRVMDIVGSGLLLIILSPLFLFIAWQIRKTKGPVYFSHVRVGRDGETFNCYKFRTMIPNAEKVLADLLANDAEARKQWALDFKLKDDPRVTNIGNFLRMYSLDELPQLWNVFVGDMSLVGPRPITEMELKLYQEKVDYYLAVRPGMTGLWQVSGRNDLSYAARINLDSWYIKNWNVWYDVAILFKTINVVLGKKGAY